MAIFWAVEFDADHGPGGAGYLVRDASGDVLGLFLADGTPAVGNLSYTTIDTNPPLPAWADKIVSQPAPIQPIEYRRLPTSQFIELFTPEESGAIESSTEPHVRQFMQLIHAPDVVEIDLGNLMVQGALRLLEQLGLIGSGRADQILSV